MAKVYVVQEGGKTTAMDTVRCKDEGTELQDILERNLDLLPGDQIEPDAPPRWMLVKREMPVPDPNDGCDRWSIDFFLVDQEAMPTFVECKRFSDTRSRREVVAQMLEYAANGHHYWTKEQIREYAEQAAKAQSQTIEDALRRLTGTEQDPDEFFSRVQDNLREAQLRLVFFLEEAPFELRSMVDFLNKQMQRSEVLIVEARQFERDGMKVVVPTLFGFTEQARMAKRTVIDRPRLPRSAWDKQRFFDAARNNLTPEQVMAVRKVYDCFMRVGRVTWGTGASVGTANAWFGDREPSIMGVDTHGGFGIAHCYMSGAEADKFQSTSGLPLAKADDRSGNTFGIAKWVGKTEALISAIEGFAAAINAGPQSPPPA